MYIFFRNVAFFSAFFVSYINIAICSGHLFSLRVTSVVLVFYFQNLFIKCISYITVTFFNKPH